MNFADPSGALIDSGLVERCASAAGISLRSGCHCNPGAREIALGLSNEELVEVFKYKDQMGYEQFLEVIDGKTAGAVAPPLDWSPPSLTCTGSGSSPVVSATRRARRWSTSIPDN